MRYECDVEECGAILVVDTDEETDDLTRLARKNTFARMVDEHEALHGNR